MRTSSGWAPAVATERLSAPDGLSLVGSDQRGGGQNMALHFLEQVFLGLSGLHVQRAVQSIQGEMIVMHSMARRRHRTSIADRLPTGPRIFTLHGARRLGKLSGFR